MKPETAIVQQAEATEQQLIERAQQALSHCNWTIGECAAQWTEKYAKGRTDADFGLRIGLDGDQVRQRRRVWETFSDVSDSYPNLKWSHFYVAMTWDDAAECLQWADEIEATVAEMKAWRRARHGEDLTEPAEDEEAPWEVEEDNEDSTCESDPGSNSCQGGGDSSEAADTVEDGVGRNSSSTKGGGPNHRHERSVVPARAEQETDRSCSESEGKSAKAESRKANAASPPRSPLEQIESAVQDCINSHEAALVIRKLSQYATELYDRDQLTEFASEMRSCLDVIQKQLQG